MAGYSGTPLVKKLGFKPGFRVAFVNAPNEFESELGELPDQTRLLSGKLSGALDLVVLCQLTESDENRIPKACKKTSKQRDALGVVAKKILRSCNRCKRKYYS